MRLNHSKGQKGEMIAVEYLIRQGFKIIEKNWRFSKFGEIDIIAQDNDALVFIEVKTRTSNEFGHPTEAISTKKLNRIKKLAEIYINRENSGAYKDFRVDMIGILFGKNTEITHIRNI